jgi:soluble lytic murein transglycosylase-like protein
MTMSNLSNVSGLAAVQSRIAAIQNRFGVSAPPSSEPTNAAPASSAAAGTGSGSTGSASFAAALEAAVAGKGTASAGGARAMSGTGSVGIGLSRLAPASSTGLGGLPAKAAPYAGLFTAAAARHGVSATLLAAVAKVESGYNARAVSPAGARGLMQIMPGTARGLGVDPLDPAQAIDGAARLLKGWQRDFGSLELALAAYNAGPGAVRRYDGIPPYRETQAYVGKVLTAMAEVQR